MTKYLAIAFLITGFLVGDAYGEASAKDFLDDYDKAEGSKKTALLMYLNGIGTGIGWMNSYAKESLQEYIYCQPEKLATTVQQDLSMLRKFIKEFPDYGAYPVGVVLREVYRYTLPC